jgi:signal transduction histidine kinase
VPEDFISPPFDLDAERAATLEMANDLLREGVAALATDRRLPTLVDSIMAAAERQTGACSSALFVHKPEVDQLRLVAVRLSGEYAGCIHAARLAGIPEFVAAAQHRSWQYLLRYRTTLIRPVEPDGCAMPETLEMHRRLGHRTLAWVPVRAGDALLGFIGLAWREEGYRPRAEQAALVLTLAQQMALTMELMQLGEDARRAAVQREQELAERARADERSRMARDIHDSLAQSFTSIAMQTETLLAQIGMGDRHRRTLERIAETARHGIAEARATALALLPLENRVAALDDMLEGLARRCTIQDGMACAFESQGAPELLPLSVQEAILRIAQEAINNALRHSGGTRVDICLEYLPLAVRLRVRDDGQGIGSQETRPGGMGLKGMRLRAEQLGGSFHRAAALPTGTEIEVILPVTPAGETT